MLLIGLAVTVVGVGLKSGLEVLQLFYSTFLLLICLQFLWMLVIKCGCSLLVMFSCLCLFTYPILFLQYAGVDPLQAGNVVQLVIVLGLTVGWISTYIFRVSNKEMTYVQQLRDYENKVMEVISSASELAGKISLVLIFFEETKHLTFSWLSVWPFSM